MRRGRADRRRLLAGVLVAFLVSTAATTAAGAQTPSNYAALGDSFTSGAGIPNQLNDPLECFRSDRNWPHLIAAATGTGSLRDRTCSGADTENMTEPQEFEFGTNPPQFDALDGNTALVTLQIGGNDIGFSNIIENCVSLLPFGSPCRDEFTSGGVDQISARIAAAGVEVGEVLDGIEARAPQARVIVVGYPALLPHSGRGCWPKVAVAWNDVPYLRAKTQELNGMLATQAAAHGAQFVDLYGPSAGKDACAGSSVRWVEPLIPQNWGAPFHPNDRGHVGMADVVRAAL